MRDERETNAIVLLCVESKETRVQQLRWHEGSR